MKQLITISKFFREKRNKLLVLRNTNVIQLRITKIKLALISK